MDKIILYLISLYDLSKTPFVYLSTCLQLLIFGHTHRPHRPEAELTANADAAYFMLSKNSWVVTFLPRGPYSPRAKSACMAIGSFCDEVTGSP